MGLGALLGDAIGSFIKRRIGIERGRPAPLLDQLDFVIGALLLSSLVYFESFSMIIVILIITPILHLLSNIFGYLVGFKEVWY
jgi:CDP-2,3-bis-(O-geranylgeranyl)-sn-glycerol synthase